MFARNSWKNEATEWLPLTVDRKYFFESLAKEVGGEEAFIYSLSKLVCGIGSLYLESAILWLASIFRGNHISLSRYYRENTIWYLEKTVRKYIFFNRDKAKRNVKMNSALLCILDYLIDNGSVVGYLLREDIA